MRQTTSIVSRLAIVVISAVGLASCAGSRSGDPGEGLGKLFSFRSVPQVASATAGRKSVEVDCPIVQIKDGQNVFRAFAGSDRSANSVRYQYSFGDLARECTSDGSTIGIRVGISGYVLAGPVGGPGSFDVPVRILVRRESDQSAVVSKVYRIAAVIPPGETQAAFSTVTEPLTIPYIDDNADSDYSIFVGFEQPGAAEKPAKPARRRQAR